MNAFLLVLGVRGVFGRSGGLSKGSWDGGKEEERQEKEERREGREERRKRKKNEEGGKRIS